MSSIPLRTSSELYALATSDAACTRTRKRLTNAQLVVLEHLFHNTSHPTMEARELLARQVDMEIKAVTIWFQNKRRTTSRHARNNIATTKNSTITHSKTSSATSRASSKSTSTSASRRPSLDRVASHSELRAPAPRTPSRRHKFNPHAPLWENMASSPIVPPSSPLARDFVEFGQAQRTQTLEWACARRRLAGTDDDAGVPALVYDAGGDTDVEDIEEAVTPPSSCDSSWTSSVGPKTTALQEPDEDTMKAALALCGLMRG
ncbi:homeodomain transcription factor [Mycena galericulata]|nr:homeodomain transcription factor [Mycena galericulata]